MRKRGKQQRASKGEGCHGKHTGHCPTDFMGRPGSLRRDKEVRQRGDWLGRNNVKKPRYYEPRGRLQAWGAGRVV